jgi:hypothetical protein
LFLRNSNVFWKDSHVSEGREKNNRMKSLNDLANFPSKIAFVRQISKRNQNYSHKSEGSEKINRVK